jgi:predicted aminopeptidase
MSIVLWITLVLGSFNPGLWIYLMRQCVGQVDLWCRTIPVERYRPSDSTLQRQLQLVVAVKRFAEDSLGFHPSDSYTTLDTVPGPVQWVVTASEPDRLQPVTWWYPVIGRAGYRGYFEQYRAIQMAQKLRQQGYDVQLGTVTAWSTLGYFNDPLLLNMLKKPKGELADVLFHELFHGTCFVKGSTDLSENLAAFVAEKATCRFFRGDSIVLNPYLRALREEAQVRRSMSAVFNRFKQLYDTVAPNRYYAAKRKLLSETAYRIRQNTAFSERRKAQLVKSLLSAQNAWLTAFAQYHNLHDSLDFAFNNIYQGNLKKMVQDLSRR